MGGNGGSISGRTAMLTLNDYKNAIPDCCKHRILDEHWDHLGLCWGLVESIKTGTVMNCDGCPEKKEDSDELLQEGPR